MILRVLKFFSERQSEQYQSLLSSIYLFRYVKCFDFERQEVLRLVDRNAVLSRYKIIDNKC